MESPIPASQFNFTYRDETDLYLPFKYESLMTILRIPRQDRMKYIFSWFTEDHTRCDFLPAVKFRLRQRNRRRFSVLLASMHKRAKGK